MIISDTINGGTQHASGAIKPADNIATNIGYGVMASGGALAFAVGTAVAPAPTIGLITVGAGTVVAANFKEVKNHFTGGKSDAEVKTEEAPAAA